MTPRAAYVLRSPPLGPQRRVLGAHAETAALEATLPPIAGASTAPHEAAPVDPAAIEAGFAEGLERGRAEAEARARSEGEDRLRRETARFAELEQRFDAERSRRLDALDAALAAFDHAAAQRLEQLAPEAIALAYEAVCRVVGPDAGRGRVIADVVRRGIDGIAAQPLRSIRLHPLALEALEAADGRVPLASHPAVHWLADASLEPTQWLLDADAGSVDIGLATQLARLMELWAASIAGRRPEAASSGAISA